MKLSEILEHVDMSNVEPNDEEYILFSNYSIPPVLVVTDLKAYRPELIIPYKAKNIEEVNLEYLGYYFKLHLGLLRGPDKLSVEFINNIELPSLPNITMQNKLIPFIYALYGIGILELDDKISQLLCINYKRLNHATEKYDSIIASELFKILDKDMFTKNVERGKFQDPIKNYIKILKPELLDENFLVYYLYYTNTSMMHDCYEELRINLPSLSKQKSLSKLAEYDHNQMEKLIDARRANKLIIRKLIDEV